MGPWVASVKFLRGLRGLRGSKYFLRGSYFYVGCVGQIFLQWVNFFYVGQSFLPESKSFAGF